MSANGTGTGVSERRRLAGPVRCLPRWDEEIEPSHDLIYVFNHPGDAVDVKAIARNPAAAVKRPGIARREVKHLDTDAVAQVLKHAEGSRYMPP